MFKDTLSLEFCLIPSVWCLHALFACGGWEAVHNSKGKMDVSNGDIKLLLEYNYRDYRIYNGEKDDKRGVVLTI